MSKSEMLTAIGLMSGTSLDGVDAAIIITDGDKVELTNHFCHLPYSDEFRNKLREAVASKKVSDNLIKELTEIHAEIVNKLLKESNLTNEDIKIVGFHGQTIDHRPDDGVTWQIGDGKLLAELTGIDVVSDFRSADVKAGGQGAPLVPLFHQALVVDEQKPIAILNLGGVGNVTYIGERQDDLIAFDIGPANALIDDLIYQHKALNYDDGGKIAASGKVNLEVICKILEDEFFKQKPPKSLDRDYFKKYQQLWENLAFEDAIATLTEFTVQSVFKSESYFPQKPQKWLVTGGGVHNSTMIKSLNKQLGGSVVSIDKLGVNPDAVEAQAFAFLAVRSLYGMNLSLPTTTGVKKSSVTGGVFCQA